MRCTTKIATGDALDEARYVDVCRAGSGAGRVEAIETAMGFKHGSLRRERRFELGEAGVKLGIVVKYANRHAMNPPVKRAE